MNATRPLFPIAAKAAAGLALALGAAGLSGCVGNPFKQHTVDPASPVAAEVTRLNRHAGKFPSFASIPNPPTDVRPAAQFGRDARKLTDQAAAVVAATEPNTWTLNNTEAFAEAARKSAGPKLEPANPADAEAFARGLRERATPPPPR